MFDDKELKQTIVKLKRLYTPSVIIEAGQPEIAEQLQETIIRLCNEVGLQVSCIRENDQLTVKNLYFSNN